MMLEPPHVGCYILNGLLGETLESLPLPGAADEVSAKDRNFLGRGAGERLLRLNRHRDARSGDRISQTQRHRLQGT
jgi:hypothetical protein